MDHSIILQSSMSPKVLQHKKHSHNKHSLTKLSLKKNLRRSSIYDKRAEVTNLIVVSSSTDESSSSSAAERKISSSSPIIISDSDNGSASAEEAAADYKKRSSCKTDEIEKWIKNVSLKCDSRKASIYLGESALPQKTNWNMRGFNFDEKYEVSFKDVDEDSDDSFKTFVNNQPKKFNEQNQNSGKGDIGRNMVPNISNEIQDNKSTRYGKCNGFVIIRIKVSTLRENTYPLTTKRV